MNLISIFRRLFLPLVVLLLAATAGAQSAYDEIKADIDKAGGVYFMYPFDTPSATPAPKADARGTSRACGGFRCR